jgi:opacity protein-like surface antigen
MNSKDLAKKIASAVVMAGAVPLAAWSSLTMPAASADFGQPFPGLAAPVPLDDRVAFASNWYVRGDLAYAAETYPNLNSAFTSDPSISPAFAFGPSSHVLNTYSAGAGMGYKVNNYFRTDLVLDYRSDVQAAGFGGTRTCTTDIGPDPNTLSPTFGRPIVLATDTCTGHLLTDIHRWDLLANGYYDLGTWDGFAPYIGAGAGVTWARIKQSISYTQSNGLPYQVTTDGFYFDFDRSLGIETYRFAWAVMAGVAIPMTDHTQLDVGYRFLDLGTVSGISPTGTSVTQRVRANELRAGVRYMID